MELKNTMTENLIESSNIRFEQAEESVSLKIGQLKLSNQRTKKNKERKKEWRTQHLQDLWDTIKRNGVHIIGVTGEEGRKLTLKKLRWEPRRDLDIMFMEIIVHSKISI